MTDYQEPLVIPPQLFVQLVAVSVAAASGADHDCADLSQVDPRRYPRTDLLWASPSCTHHSRAQGVARDTTPVHAATHRGRVEWGAVRDAEPDRSRATMFDVIRFAEVHGYDGIVVENAPEVRDWRLWPWWWSAMTDGLGYRGRKAMQEEEGNSDGH